MDRIGELVTDPVWIFSTLFAAFVMNLLSAYFKEWADRARSRLSERAKEKLALEGEERKRRVTEMVNDTEALHFAYFVAIKHFIFAAFFLVASVGTATIVFSVPAIVVDHSTARQAMIMGFVAVAITFAMMVLSMSSMTKGIERSREIEISMNIRTGARE